jgi:hypothetical protein
MRLLSYCVPAMDLQTLVRRSATSALALALLLQLAAAKNKGRSDCERPPETLSGSVPTEQEQEEGRKLKATGTIAVTVSEKGDVVEAEVLKASPAEAKDLLLRRAREFRYKARPGCGPYKVEIDFDMTRP